MTFRHAARTITLVRSQPIAIDVLDRESFLRYGETIELVQPDLGKQSRGEDDYQVLTRIPSTGWRLALHCVRVRWTDVLYVCNNRRIFTPQYGTTLICVALPRRTENVQVFLLDRSVMLNSEIPHCLLTLSAESWVQVGESFDTQAREIKLRRTLVPAVLWH